MLSATSALAPFKVRFAPLPSAVTPPLANSSSASPARLKFPVNVVGAAAVMSNVAAAVPPVRLIVPVLARPAAVTVVATRALPMVSVLEEELVKVPPTVRLLPDWTFSVLLLVKPTAVVTEAPPARIKLPALLASLARAPLVVVSLFNATRARGPLRDSSAPAAIEVALPLANSNSAFPERSTTPVQVAGAAAVLSKVARPVRPAKSIVPVLLSPATVTCVAVRRPLLPIVKSPVLVSTPPKVSLLPPLPPVTTLAPETSTSSVLRLAKAVVVVTAA